MSLIINKTYFLRNHVDQRLSNFDEKSIILFKGFTTENGSFSYFNTVGVGYCETVNYGTVEALML